MRPFEVAPGADVPPEQPTWQERLLGARKGKEAPPPTGKQSRRFARAVARVERKSAARDARDGHGAKPSARELFALLSNRRFQSRPILVPARVEKRPVVLADGTVEQQNFYVEAVRGEPTFRNVIDGDGKWV